MVYTYSTGKISRALAICLIWLLPLTTTVWAQNSACPPIAFRHYSMADGLSHNTTRDFIQDADGFIWISTGDGLNKFDGYQFTTYYCYSTDSTPAATYPTRGLAEDQQQRLWVGTWGGGVYQYHPQYDRLLKVTFPDEQQLAARYIYSIYCDAQGYVWIGTNGQGLYCYNPTTEVLTNFRADLQDSTSLSSDRVIDIAEDEQGNLYLCTLGGGVNYFDRQTEEFIHFRHDPDDPGSLSSDDAFCLLYDRQQRLWVGTWGGGLNRLSDDHQRFVRYHHQPGDPHQLSSDQVWDIAEDQHGWVWVGTDQGLARYREDRDNFHVYKNDPVDANSLSSNSVKGLYGDPQGGVWIGTSNRGFCLFDRSMVNMAHHYVKSGNSLSYNDVTALTETKEGLLLVGTDGGGLDVLDKEHRYHNYRHQTTQANSIASNKVKALLTDEQGRHWVGFWGSGLDLFEHESGQFTHFNRDDPRDSVWLNNNNVTDIAQDRDGILWLSTFGGGVNRLDPETTSFRSYVPSQRGYDPEQGDKFVWTVLADAQNQVWAGTSNGHLIKLDRTLDKFRPVPTWDSLGSGHAINTLASGEEDELWIGSEGGGLFLLNTAAQTLQSFTMEAGLPSNYINAIERNNEELWMSTNGGVARLHVSTQEVTLFSNAAAQQEQRYNARASYQVRSGDLLFGGTHGYHRFHPDSIKTTKLAAPMVLTDFQLFNQSVAPGDASALLSRSINRTDSIVLSYDQSVISIAYAALNYYHPEMVRYRYRMKGFVDERWQHAGTERKVTYTNLEPGTYDFEVTTTADTNLNYLRTMHLTVVPPWWATWYFRLLAVIVGAGLLALVYYWRIRRTRQANLRLEELVKERTTQLYKINHDLQEKGHIIQEQKEEIQTQTEELIEANEQLEARVNQRTSDLKKSNEELDNFVYRVSHDVRAPLSSVLGLIELVKIESDEEKKNAYWEMAIRSINKLDGFVRDILDYSRNARTSVVVEPIDFQDIIASVVTELQYMDGSQQVHLQEDYQLPKAHHNDRRRLHVIFQNIISNAIKYRSPWADPSMVSISVVTNDTKAVVTIEDNGIGISEGQVSKVFGMFYRANDRSDGSGIGLYIVKEAVDKLGGSIDLQSVVGEGTTMTIKLPDLRQSAEQDSG